MKKELKALFGFYRVHRVMFNLLFAVIMIVILARGIPEIRYVVAGTLLFALGLFSVVGVNNIRDVIADQVSKKGEMEGLNPLATGVFTTRQAWLAAIVPFALGLLVAGIWTNKSTFFFFLAFIGASLFYDIYGKRFVVAPFISPACMALFVVLLGFMMERESDPLLPYLVLIFYVFMVAGQIGADILDYEGDKAAGYRRLTVICGPLKGAYVAIVMAAVIPLLLLAAYIHLNLSWLSLPVTALVVVLIVPLSKRFRHHASEMTFQSGAKTLWTLTAQYVIAMVALIVGLGIVGG